MFIHILRVPLVAAFASLAAAQNLGDLTLFNYRSVFEQTSTVTVYAEASRTGVPCQIRVTGGDTRGNVNVFIFAWGDGYFTTGFFPQVHTYTACNTNYVVEVRPDYGTGPQPGALTLARLQNLYVNRSQDVSATPVTLPSAVPPFTSRHLPVPTTLQPMGAADLTGISFDDFAYVLAMGAKVQNDLVNLNRYPAGAPFQQVVLKDPAAANNSAYSQWYLDPMSLVLGTSGGPVTIGWSTYLRETGRSFGLNSPANYYYGGKIDGYASSTYAQTVALILQHAAGYELVRRHTEYGMGDDTATDMALSLLQSMQAVRSGADAYLAAGRPFNTWNDPLTGQDETIGTYSTLAYTFLREAETRGLGYRIPTKRMMEFLQRFNTDWQVRYNPAINSQEAATFRSTLMVAAISHALQLDLRNSFQVLNFPVDAVLWNQMTGQSAAGLQVNPTQVVVAASGGTGTHQVTAPADTTWSAVSNATWLVVESGSAARGPAQLQWRAAANTGTAARTAAIAVGNQSITITQNAPGPVIPSYRLIPVTPCRVMDTRDGEGKTGAFGPPFLAGGGTRQVPVPASTCGIPASAKAYSLNFTVLPKATLGYLTTWPAGQTMPIVSTLNSFHGGVVANAAIVPAGTDGAINVYVTDSAEVILDINGYFDDVTAANAFDFFPLTPCRAVDTRTGTGFSGAFGPPSLTGLVPRDFPLLTSACGVPASARAYSLNSTVVPNGPLSYLTLHPAGSTRPIVSTLNSFDGVIVANAALVPGGNGSAITAFATNNTDLILDLNGYFAPPATDSLRFYPATPCRVVDTRFGQAPIVAGGTTRVFSVSGVCGIPATAKAFSLNVTVVPEGPLAYLTLWPTGVAQPLVSTLNSFQGRVLANAAIVPAGTNGTVSLYVTNPTHVILDVNGYFAP